MGEAITSGKKVAVPDEIYERVQEIATAEGTTVEELTTKALERDLARRWLGRAGCEGEVRRATMTNDKVEATVERVSFKVPGRLG